MEMAQDPLQNTIDLVNNMMAERAAATEAEVSEEPQVEASPEAENPEPEPEPEKPKINENRDFNRRFAQLAKRERSFRDRQDEFKKMQAELAELREKSSAPNTAAQELEEIKRIARENPAQLLSRLDTDWDEFNKGILAGNKNPDDYAREAGVSKLMNRIEELESKLSKREEQEVVSRQERAYNNFVDEINKFIETNNEDFELIHSRGEQGLVANVMQEHYNSTGQVMEFGQAAQMVEDYLEEQARSYFGSKKIAKKYKDSFGNEAKSEAPRQPDSRPKTLSNSVAAVGTTTDGEVHSKEMTRDEHKAYLARTLNFFGE